MITSPDETVRPTPESPVSPVTPDDWRERWQENGPRHDRRVARNAMRALAAIALAVGAVWAATSLL